MCFRRFLGKISRRFKSYDGERAEQKGQHKRSGGCPGAKRKPAGGGYHACAEHMVGMEQPTHRAHDNEQQRQADNTDQFGCNSSAINAG